MKVLVWVLPVLAAVIIEAELIAWCRPLQRALIRRAAAPLPRQHRERYLEEWYRELEELPDGPVTRLSWVLLLLLRRGSLARTLGVSRTVLGFTRALKGPVIAMTSFLLIVLPLRADWRVTTGFYILVFAIVALLYVVSLKVNPWVKCAKCKNQPKRWVSSYGHVCPGCNGYGIQIRFARRFIFGEPPVPAHKR